MYLRFNIHSPALVLAALNNKTDIVDFLHDQGASLNHPCRSGMTALMFAAKTGSLSLVKVCLILFDEREREGKGERERAREREGGGAAK